MVAPAERPMAIERPDRTVRVLWLINQLGKGGAERLLLSALACHDRDRFSFEVAYLLRGNDIVAPDFEQAGVRVHCLGVDGPYDLRWAWRLRRLIARSDYDLVHAHSPLAASVARLALRSISRAKRPRLVVTEHAIWHSYRLPTRLINDLTFHLDDAHLAVSEEAHRAMPRRLRRRTRVVVHGVLLDELAKLRDERCPVRAELGVADDEVVVMTVANMTDEKSYPDLLRAARTVVDMGVPVRFVAAGHGPLERELHGLHDSLGLGDRFVFLGYRRDAVRLLAGADLFAMASRFEGLPVALMEALTIGLPVVATTAGGIPDAVRDGVEGRLVPPGRPDLLASALIELTRDPARRGQMAEAARARSSRYDMAHAVGILEDVYAEVLAASPRRKV